MNAPWAIHDEETGQTRWDAARSDPEYGEVWSKHIGLGEVQLWASPDHFAVGLSRDIEDWWPTYGGKEIRHLTWALDLGPLSVTYRRTWARESAPVGEKGQADG